MRSPHWWPSFLPSRGLGSRLGEGRHPLPGGCLGEPGHARRLDRPGGGCRPDYRLTSTVFAPVLPVCWMMNRAATWRGLHQLIRAPFLWEKTPHTNSKPAAVQATTVKSQPDRPVAELTLAA